MYAELHCHSVFSLLDGASEPEALAARAKSLGMPAMALTDHDDLGGVVRFSQAAREIGIPAIVGGELTVETGGQRTHLVLLCETREGYGNLSSLITRARLDQPRGMPCVSLDTLANHTKGLFALTGCPQGWVPSLVAQGRHHDACEAASTLHDLFPDRLAIEVWDHQLPEERDIVRGLLSIARATGLPWVVTNDVHYAEPSGRIVHDVLSCLRHQRPLDQMGTALRPNAEWYLKSPQQMARRWRHNPAGIHASLEIAKRCAFRFETLNPTFPRFPLPPAVSADEYLARLVEQGAIDRWGKPIEELEPQYHKQVTYELGLICRLGLAGYFLIVWDIVRFAHREGVLCQGRGSAANSAVCYCLGITAVDPVKLNLLFERFLTEDRKEAPDIDIDFAHRDREKVLQYVYERYGREHAAMVCEHITYRGRSAVRDAARVLGFSVQQADVLSALSDRFSAKATAESLRAGTPGEEMLARNPDRDPRSDAPGIPGDARKQKEAWNAEQLLAIRHNESRMVNDKTKRHNEKEEARKHPDKGALTSRDRPRPRAAYEPSGNANGRDTAQQNARIENTLKPLGIGGSPSGIPVTPRREKQRSHRKDDGYHPDNGSRSAGNNGDARSANDALTQAGLDPNDRRVQALPAIVEGLHQAPRHRSIHVGGFVLTAEPLRTVVPIEPASMPGRTVIQWERDDLDPAGLIKIDLLGLGMLTVLQDCLKYIRASRGVTIDLGLLDMMDQAVYDDICAADTVGVFQIESRAQMNTLPRLKPRCFYDLVVEVAIIRPGPIQGEMVHPYLRRRAGTEEVTYPHPSLEPILKRTLGVPLFQEQGMQVAITAAGFTPSEADHLRRAMGHKRSRERMAAICEKLLAGMAKNGIPEDVGRRIYNQINAFADYGFPESHSASFALIVYASAYLRHYYAPEFLAAMLNAQPMGFYSVGTLIEDAKRHSVEVRPVDLTCSAWDHTVELADGRVVVPYDGEVALRPRAGDVESKGGFDARRAPAVRLGLRLVRGLGAGAREKLEEALRDGPFVNIPDVVERAGLDQRALRSLAEAGAFDSMVGDVASSERRRVALWQVLEATRGDAGPLAPSRKRTRRPPLPPMTKLETTDADYRMTGVSLSGHPMKHLRAILEPNEVRTAKDLLKSGRDGEKAAHAGLAICRQRPGTAKGFVFLSLEDETGIINVVVTPKRFEKQALLISTSPLLLVRGTLQVEDGVVNLRGEEFRALSAGAGEAYAKSHDFH